MESKKRFGILPRSLGKEFIKFWVLEFGIWNLNNEWLKQNFQIPENPVSATPFLLIPLSI